MENEKKETSLWPSLVVKGYIDIMIEEINKRNMRNNVFSPRVWQTILHTLKEKTGREFDMKQIKQKFNRLRQLHATFSHLLQQTGFGWDAETNTVTATEEVWSTYLRAHSNAAPFKKKGLKLYKLLGVIFNKSSATEVLHHSSMQNPPNTDDENELDKEYLHGGIHVNLDDEEEEEKEEEDSSIIERVTRNGKRTIKVQDRKARKEYRTLQVEDALQAWIESKLKAEAFVEASKLKAEASLARVERYRAKSVEASSSATTSSEYTMARCVIELNEMENISDDSYTKAVDKFKDPYYREAFLNMARERRKAWIDRLV